MGDRYGDDMTDESSFSNEAIFRNEASYVFSGGMIYTMDPGQPWAQAMVVRGRSIVYVGSTAGAEPFVDDQTGRIDLGGGMCLPGFIDAHNHLASMALTKLGVSVARLSGKEAILGRIKEWVDEQDPDAPLRGYGWWPDVFDDQSPRREWLDAITGDRPMTILSGDSHDLWFNTAAMRAAGIDATTPDPDPGSQYYKRDADGTPTGHAVEAAASVPILKAVGYFDPDGFRAAQALTIDPAPSWGITTYMEAGIIVGDSSDNAEPIYQMLIDRDETGELPLRIVGTVWTRDAQNDPQQIADTLIDWNSRLRSEHVSVSICKLWSDGGHMAHGALMLEPFTDDPSTCGSMTFPAEAIAAQIEAVQRAGFDMHIHVDADGSARTVLDAFESVFDRLGNEGTRHTIAHNSMVAPEDINRYAELGLLANITPLWATDKDGLYWDIYTKLIGPDRIQDRLFPYGDLVRAGTTVTIGADIPGVDIHEIPPLLQIQAAVTRKEPGFPEQRPLVERQALTLHDALRAYTINGAYQLRLEHLIGSLEVGKRADIVVLGADIFATPVDEIYRIPITLTMMDGKVTHVSDGTADAVTG